jgi:hypothetical protein
MDISRWKKVAIIVVSVSMIVGGLRQTQFKLGGNEIGKSF